MPKIKSISVYQKITDRVINHLKNNEIVWENVFKHIKVGAPHNKISGDTYKGINFWLTLFEERTTPEWLTYLQAIKLKGNIKKGECGVSIIFYKILKKEIDGKEVNIPLVKRTTVFNIDQTEGIENTYLKNIENKFKDKIFNPIKVCECFLKENNHLIPEINHKWSNKAYYSVTNDVICLPDKRQFGDELVYYSTLLHEICHSTGSKHRLNRPSLITSSGKETAIYAKEELVAELSSTFLLNSLGIDTPRTEEQTALYIKYWLKRLKNDNTLIINAMKEGYKILEYFNLIKT